MFKCREPMQMALQTSTYPYTSNLGQLGLHGGSTTHMFSDSHSGSTTRMGPSMGPTDNTVCSASNVTWGAQALYDHRPNGQNALVSSHNSQTSLPRFGTVSGGWTDYLVQFNLFADHNNWDNRLRAINLAMNLRGTARSVLSDLGQAQRGDFGALVSALSACFGLVHQSEMYRVKMKSRVRRKGESIPELAQDIRKLVRLAYPLAPVEVREQLAKDCFVDAMNDSELEWSILHGRPKNVWDAVKLALEYEAFQRGKRGRQADFRPFRAGEETLSGGVVPNITMVTSNTILGLIGGRIPPANDRQG